MNRLALSCAPLLLLPPLVWACLETARRKQPPMKVLPMAAKLPDAKNRKPVPHPKSEMEQAYFSQGDAALPLLRNKLRTGTRDEKSDALSAFIKYEILELFPDVISQITDTAPERIDRHTVDHWFFGWWAINALIRQARPLGFDFEKPGNMQAFSVDPDMERLLKPEASYAKYDDFYKARQKAFSIVRQNKPRLRQIQQNWERWWREYSKAHPSGPSVVQPAETRVAKQNGPFTVSIAGANTVLVGKTPAIRIVVENTSKEPVEVGPKAAWQFKSISTVLKNAQGKTAPISPIGMCGNSLPYLRKPPQVETMQPGAKKLEPLGMFPPDIDMPGAYQVVLTFKLNEAAKPATLVFPFKVIAPPVDLMERAIAAEWQPRRSAEPNRVRQWLYEGKWKIVRTRITPRTITKPMSIDARVEFAKGFKVQGRNVDRFDDGWYHFVPGYPDSPNTDDAAVAHLATGYELRLPDGSPL